VLRAWSVLIGVKKISETQKLKAILKTSTTLISAKLKIGRNESK
jgi:hypothetical protein